MAFIRVSDPQGELFSFVENFSLELHPRTYFLSSSADGVISGSMPLQARSSADSIKLNLDSGRDAYKSATAFSSTGFEGYFLDEGRGSEWFDATGEWRDLSELFTDVVLVKASDSLRHRPDGEDPDSEQFAEDCDDLDQSLRAYMNGVRLRPSPIKTSKKFSITRFSPVFSTPEEVIASGSAQRNNRRTALKNIIVGSLMPAYEVEYNSPQHGFVNYQSINFFTNGTSPDEWNDVSEHERIPTKSAIVYSNFTGSGGKFLDGDLIGTQGRGPGPGGRIEYQPGYRLTDQKHQGPYSPYDGPFTLSFYINPRYTPKNGKEFHAGTIMHLSSTYAVSLVTGSGTDHRGKKNGFRLMLQLSSSADYPPSRWTINNNSNTPIFEGISANKKKDPYRFSFLTPDNSLRLNNWHHVCIRWGGNTSNQGTGSIAIDERFDISTKFHFPSSSIATLSYFHQDPTQRRLMKTGDPDALFIGNFYQGSNSGTDGIIRFFNHNACNQEGLYPRPYYDIDSDLGHTAGSDPVNFQFNNPLNAEIHDIRYYKQSILDEQVLSSSRYGPEDRFQDRLGLYIPVMYSPNRKARRYSVTGLESSRRKSVKQTTNADYAMTLPMRINEYTVPPYNVGFAYNTGGHIINAENYLEDFSNNVHPRLLFITASSTYNPPPGYMAGSTDNSSYTGPESNADLDSGRRAERLRLDTVNHYREDVNNFLYKTGSIVKRNLTILPNDNGKFIPNFKLLVSSTFGPGGIGVIDDGEPEYPVTSSNMYYYTNRDGSLNFSKVNLERLIPRIRAGYTHNTRDSLLPDGKWSVERFNEARELITSATGSDGTWHIKKVDALVDLVSPKNPYGRRPQDIDDGSKARIDDQDIYPRSTGFFSTGDSVGDAVSIFNISNLYYGDSIQAGTFEISDHSISGSREQVGISLRDDGSGGLFRADCDSAHATWNTVGNVFYNEGFVYISSPNIPHFGKDRFETKFKGSRDLNTLIVNVPVRTAEINSSSNPAYHSIINGFSTVSSSLMVNDIEKEFVYVTGINLHDDNYNVVAKANLSQPVKKRLTDTYMFRLKLDF